MKCHEKKVLPDPKCELCWGTGESTQRVTTRISYRRPPAGIPENDAEALENQQFFKLKCDCIVKQEVIRDNREKRDFYTGKKFMEPSLSNEV